MGFPRFLDGTKKIEEKGLEEGAQIQIVDSEAKGVSSFPGGCQFGDFK